jgi:hypothetical protein
VSWFARITEKHVKNDCLVVNPEDFLSIRDTDLLSRVIAVHRLRDTRCGVVICIAVRSCSYPYTIHIQKDLSAAPLPLLSESFN